MNCRDLDALVGPYLDGEFGPGEREALEAHLADCAACAEATAFARSELASLRERARQASPKAPSALRTRLIADLDRLDRRARAYRAVRLGAMAAGVAVAVVGAQQGYRAFQRKLYVEDVAARHARQFPLEVGEPDPTRLEAWFGGKLDHRVSVPSFPNTVAAGARLLNVREKQAAYIRYEASGTDAPRANMGLFVYDDAPGDVAVGELTDAAHGNSHGYNVVSWREGDVVYQLVSDLDEADIQRLLPPQRSAPVPERRPAVQLPFQPAPSVQATPASYTP